MAEDVVRVGLLGCGHVGSALVRLITDNGDAIEGRTGVRLQVEKVAVRNLSRERDVALPASVFTNDANAVVADPDVDVVVEVIGGIEPARELIVEALQGGKPVISANKELLANHGKELFETAENAGRRPAVRGVRRRWHPAHPPAARVARRRPHQPRHGDRQRDDELHPHPMTEEGASFSDALAEAQTLGFAERDPTADVEGFDAAAKAAIIASDRVRRARGRGRRLPRGHQRADRRRHGVGARARLRGEAPRGRGGGPARCRRARAPDDDPGEPPARLGPRVVQRGVPRGRRGRRAHVLRPRRRWWSRPRARCSATSSTRPRTWSSGGRGATIGALARKPVRPIDEVESQFYLQLEVADQPGVLAEIAAQFGEHDVSIKSMQQIGIGDDARIIFITHRAREADLRATVARAARREVRAPGRVGPAGHGRRARLAGRAGRTT